MPGGDRTGPLGMGPRTGRAAGYCAGYRVPGYSNPAPGCGYGYEGGYGRGYGRGFGRGMGRGGGRGFFGRGRMRGAYYDAPPENYPPEPVAASAEDEIRMLKSEERNLSNSLKQIRNRLNEIERGAEPNEA